MNLTESKTRVLDTRQHFGILDGLRGVAAVCVVIFHFMEIAITDPSNNFIEHAYLAVDFFFCLSGFVIAYAYDDKIKDIGIVTFLKLRLIRLHPLVIIGTVIGLLSFLFDPFVSLYAIYGFGKTFLLFLTSCFMIPYPIVQERYYNLFHLNPPAWSLFWEYIANIFYAFILYKVSRKALWVLVLVAAILICYEANKEGNLVVGWNGDTFMGGGIRVFYSFLIGMMVYRFNWIIRSRLGFISVSILLISAFLVPFVIEFNMFTEPILVLFYFPLMVALGAGSHLRLAFARLCKFSGEISYPLYMVHYPFLWIFLSYVQKEKPAMNKLEFVIPFSVTLLIAFAWLIMRYLDVPIRRYLKNKMKEKLIR